jgi:hypothetical protein
MNKSCYQIATTLTSYLEVMTERFAGSEGSHHAACCRQVPHLTSACRPALRVFRLSTPIAATSTQRLEAGRSEVKTRKRTLRRCFTPELFPGSPPCPLRSHCEPTRYELCTSGFCRRVNKDFRVALPRTLGTSPPFLRTSLS